MNGAVNNYYMFVACAWRVYLRDSNLVRLRRPWFGVSGGALENGGRTREALSLTSAVSRALAAWGAAEKR